MSNETKQTAVEWLLDRIEDLDSAKIWENVKQQAKEMEKQQMWEYIKKNYCIGHRSLEFHRLEFEEFYDLTYGGGNK